MLVLMIMLAVALIPTGRECRLENYSSRYRSPYTYEMKVDSYEIGYFLPPVYPGSPAKCCFLALSDKAGFIGTKHKFDVMMISEALPICTSLTRVFKLFCTSSEFSKTWLRHKPARMCKRVAKKLEERYCDSYLQLERSMYIAYHCAIMVFIAFARAIYDCADSLLFEVCQLKLVFSAMC